MAKSEHPFDQNIKISWNLFLGFKTDWEFMQQKWMQPKAI